MYSIIRRRRHPQYTSSSLGCLPLTTLTKLLLLLVRWWWKRLKCLEELVCFTFLHSLLFWIFSPFLSFLIFLSIWYPKLLNSSFLLRALLVLLKKPRVVVAFILHSFAFDNRRRPFYLSSLIIIYTHTQNRVVYSRIYNRI